MASKIIFTAGAKGGSGKSTALRFIASWLAAHNVEPCLIDADDENRTLSRFFPQADQITISSVKAADIIVVKAIEEDEPLILLDLKAGTGREMLQWFADIPFEVLRGMGVTFVCVGSITSSPDSVQSFLNWAAALKGEVSYVVFRNLKDGKELADYDETKEALAFQKARKPSHITLEKLDDQYQTELERMGIVISDVLEGKKELGPLFGGVPGIIIKQRLRRYQSAVFDQLDKIQAALLP